MNDSDRRRSPDGFDDDAIFADIIAHLKAEESEPEQAVRPVAGDAHIYRWTIPEPAGEAGDPPAEDTTEDTSARPRGEPPGDTKDDTKDDTADDTKGQTQGGSQAVGAPQGWRAHEVDDEDEHFEPRPVTPLPVGDLQFWAILAGMIGGPLLLVYLVFFNRNMSSYWTLTAIAMSVGGFALLVSRLPGDEGEDDDGARL